MKIASASFAEGAFIAPEFAYGRIGENGATERSENRNPELHWTDVPEGTKSFVVLCLDDDVPTDRQTKMGDGLLSVTQPRRRFVHWVQANIPAEVESIPEGFLTGEQKRNGAFGRPGVNDYVGNAMPGPDGTGRTTTASRCWRSTVNSRIFPRCSVSPTWRNASPATCWPRPKPCAATRSIPRLRTETKPVGPLSEGLGKRAFS